MCSVPTDCMESLTLFLHLCYLNAYCNIYPCVHRSRDEHNIKVKKSIAEEIFLNKENVYSRTLIESKMKRLFLLLILHVHGYVKQTTRCPQLHVSPCPYIYNLCVYRCTYNLG